jgi:ribulose-phosphate 3-epimerase
MTQTIKRTSEPLLAPSLLSADFAKLGEEIRSIETAGADWLHVDVMDGHFVPNLTLGPLIVEAIRPITKLPLDCHLMVSHPQNWIIPFAKAGANWITVHAEATPHLDRVLHQIHDQGCKAGVSLNPGSPLSLIEEILPLVDLVLIMSVNPGFGGQKFIPNSITKIERLKAMQKDHSFLIEVDGGVSSKNIESLRKAGADVFVAGSAIFGALDRKQVIEEKASLLKMSIKLRFINRR